MTPMGAEELMSTLVHGVPLGVWLLATGLLCALLSAALLWWLQARKQQLWVRTAQDKEQMLAAQSESLRGQLQQQQLEAVQWKERAAALPRLEEKLQKALAEAQAGAEKAGRLQAQLEAERTAAADKLKLLEEARSALTHQFKALANEIFDEKSQRFTQQNQQNIGALLDPVRQRLGDFQQKIEQFYDSEGKQRSALSEQVRQLLELNQGLSADAQNLTRALKGESKTRGNWGEVVLRRILEQLGLQEGREFEVQPSHSTAEGRLQPDVVIHLPDDRHIVVDSKVSLVDWELYSSTEDEEARKAAMRRHRDSLRQHIKGLSGKNYQDLYALGSLDCVVMFVPVEPALLAVVAEDHSLFEDAWKQHVLLVSASTLFFALRTVAFLWRQDAQNRNALDIANRGEALYDKVQLFIAEMDKLGQHLDRAQNSYEVAKKRLTGAGGVIRQTEMLTELGVKAKKPLPEGWTAETEDAGVAPALSLGGESGPDSGADSVGADKNDA